MREALGSKGTLTAQIQLALRRANFYNGDVDGIFGELTRNAVIAFQRDRRLTPDGIVGNITFRRLIPYLKGFTTHTVRAGDTLFRLAQQYKTSLRKITDANPTVNPENMRIGSVIYIPFDFPVVATDIPYSSALCGYISMGLSARYPFIELTTIGKSVIGKPLHCLKIGRGKTELFYNASHHANEWITTPVLLKFIEDYALAYTSGTALYSVPAAELYNKISLYIVPMVDPDGVDLVTGVLNSGDFYDSAEAYSKNYPGISFPSGWKANINGVDLNLQYPAGWENAKKIKFSAGYTRPGPRDYVGTAPLAEPESSAVYNFTMSRNFKLTLSYHTQGEVIYWKYLDFEPEGSRRIAEYFARVSGYSVENTPYSSGFAGYKDWFIEKFNRPGYTIEVGKGTNPLSVTQFNSIYEKNIGILTGAMTQI